MPALHCDAIPIARIIIIISDSRECRVFFRCTRCPMYLFACGGRFHSPGWRKRRARTFNLFDKSHQAFGRCGAFILSNSRREREIARLACVWRWPMLYANVYSIGSICAAEHTSLAIVFGARLIVTIIITSK